MRELRDNRMNPEPGYGRPKGRRTVALAVSLLIGLSAAGLAGQTAMQRNDLSAKDRARVLAVTQPSDDFSKPEAYEAMAGGAATSRKTVNRDSFSHFSANLSFADQERFKLGNALFRKHWVSSPASTEASDGLGPLFNARSCQSCHLKDGRGHPPEGDADATSMFLRLSVPPRDDEQRAALADRSMLLVPEPVYGG
jgi:CxxC motif-containing protein (DUF1111 family)